MKERQVEAAKIVPLWPDFLQKRNVISLLNVIIISKRFCGKTVETTPSAAATLRAAGKTEDRIDRGSKASGRLSEKERDGLQSTA